MKPQVSETPEEIKEQQEAEKMDLGLRYFYGTETESVLFYIMPKLLWRNNILFKLSSEAKTLYCLLLDRLKLSSKNDYKDKEGRVYVYFTIDEGCYELGKTNKTLGKIFQQLEDKGIIERHKQGQGKADRIYVKNISSLPADRPSFHEYKKNLAEEESLLHEANAEVQSATELTERTMVYTKPISQTVEEFQSTQTTIKHENLPKATTYSLNPKQNEKLSVDNFAGNGSQVQEVHSLTGSNFTPRNVENTLQEVEKVHRNNTEVTNIQNNNTDVLKPTSQPRPQPTYPHPLSDEVLKENWGVGWSEMDADTRYDVIDRLLRDVAFVGEENLKQGRSDLSRLFYNLTANKEAMGIVLDILLGIEEKEMISLAEDELSHGKFQYQTYLLYRQSLLAMLTSNRPTKTKHGYIKYSELIEAIVPHILINGGYYSDILFDNMAESTVAAYMDASNTSETPIKHKIPYMQSTIWTTLLEGCLNTEADFGRFALSVGITH